MTPVTSSHSRTPRMRLLLPTLILAGLSLLFQTPRAQAAGEKICFALEGNAAAGCTSTAALSVTPNSPFAIKVVYDPGGGANTGGVTLEFTYGAGLGTPTCVSEAAAAGLDLELDPVTVTAAQTKVTGTYATLGAGATGIAQLIKCTFSGGPAGTANLEWQKDGSGGSAAVLDSGGAPIASVDFQNRTVNLETPPCSAPTANGTFSVTGLNNSGTATCRLTWTAPAGAGTGATCPLTATPYAITANGVAVAGSPFASTVLTTDVTAGVAFGQTVNFGMTMSHTGGALAQLTGSCSPLEGSAPTATLKVPGSALQGAPLKVNGDFADTDSNTVALKVYYKSGANAIKTVNGTKVGRSASATSGKWEATIPGADVKAGEQLKFILVAEDEIGLRSILPTDVTAPDLVNGVPDDAAFNKINCAAANAPCIAGDDITVGDRLAFGDTDGDGFANQPVPSEMPFNPTDVNEPSLARPGVDIKFSMNAPSKVTARIYTLNGKLIRQLPSSNTDFLRNTCHFLQGCNWDGTDFGDSTQDFVTNGLYIVNIYVACNTGAEPEGKCPDGFKSTTVNMTKGLVVMK